VNTSEAKKRLFLYRGPIDDADPQFAEALAQARGEAELAAWLREHTRSYEAIRSKLREIKPTGGLAEKIIRQSHIPFHWGGRQMLALAATAVIFAGLTALWLNVSHRDKNSIAQGREVVVTGEVLDMTCYVAHNLSGPSHAECARECIRKGLPVGIKGENGKTYLLVGDKHAINAELADYASKTVTVRGKQTMRDGFALLQVEEIRKF
jgi:hypothetical protein